MGNSTTNNPNLEKHLDNFSEKDRLCGFINTNNICYANSVIQCLYSVRHFRIKLLSQKQFLDENSTLKALNELFQLIESKKKKTATIDTKKFMQSVKKNNQEFNNEDHHDAHEFLIWLLDNINETLKEQNKKIKGGMNNPDSTLISEIFEGKQSSTIKCLNCEKVTERTETYLNLSVDVEQNTSLAYCLKKYISKELMKKKDKFYCDNCNSLQEAERQVLLETLPQILIVHLKRFKVIQYNQKKLNYSINIPDNIKLDYLLKDKNRHNEKTLYNLSAVVVHVGSGSEYGHYYCLVKVSGKWIKFDDEAVQIINDDDLNNYFGNPDEEYESNSNFCGYLLFFELAE